MDNLGELKRIDVRRVWKHEASDFTPWLRENIGHLSDILGLELDLIEREAPVGDFSCDLIAKDLNSDRWVIIENQLAPTDHTHLGQLITYGASRKAGVVVWVSPVFRDEHKEALEWLNSTTGEGVDFFGVQVEVFQIGDSPLAPSFSIAVRPSAWTKPRPTLTARQQAYNAFFTQLLAKLKRAAPGITSAQSAGYSSWFSFSGGRSGCQFSFAFTQDRRFRVELYVDTGDAEQNQTVFDALVAGKDAIEAEVGLPIVWDSLEGRRACRIGVYAGDYQVTDPAEVLSRLEDWAVGTMIAFHKAIAPRLKTVG